MSDLPFWRHEVPLPRREDYANEEDYEQAMNMWAHDQLYGWDEDLHQYELELAFERWLEEVEPTAYEPD